MTVFEGGAALIAAKREVAERLRRVCPDMSDSEFEVLVSRIASIDLKYRTRDIMELLYGSPPSSCANPQAGPA
jgi:hypothetical protein